MSALSDLMSTFGEMVEKVRTAKTQVEAASDEAFDIGSELETLRDTHFVDEDGNELEGYDELTLLVTRLSELQDKLHTGVQSTTDTLGEVEAELE